MGGNAIVVMKEEKNVPHLQIIQVRVLMFTPGNPGNTEVDGILMDSSLLNMYKKSCKTYINKKGEIVLLIS